MKKLLWALFYLFVFSFLACNSFSYLDPDFGWHLRFGQIIWESRSLPHDQIFMWSLGGQQWVDHMLGLDPMLAWEKDALTESWREEGHEDELRACGEVTADFRTT